MSAIDKLKSDQREVEKLFASFEKARTAARKRDIFEQIADALAVHATIEEKHFYPAAKAKDTEDMLLEAAEEHLSVKRLIADLLELDPKDDTFEAKVMVLKEQIEHHVEEEEKELFPKVKKMLDEETMLSLEQEMAATEQELLEAGDPRNPGPAETGEAAPV
ncbi:MAG TPA: hemerythrin domain-containing protein [Polyangia bacterium]